MPQIPPQALKSPLLDKSAPVTRPGAPSHPTAVTPPAQAVTQAVAPLPGPARNLPRPALAPAAEDLIEHGLATLERGLEQISPEQLCRRSQGLPRVSQLSGLTSEALLESREALQKVSHHAVLRLGEPDATVLGSAQSLTARTPRSGFDRDRLPTAQGTLTIVAHGDGETIGGKSPEALAAFLKGQGIRSLAGIELLGCRSQALVKRFESALARVGLEVGRVSGHADEVGVDRGTGQVVRPGSDQDSGALGINSSKAKRKGEKASGRQAAPRVIQRRPSDDDIPTITLKKAPERVDHPFIRQWGAQLTKSAVGSEGVIEVNLKARMDEVDQLMELAPEDFKAIFSLGDKQQVLAQFCAHPFVQTTLMDTVKAYDTACGTPQMAANAYQASGFGLDGGCGHSSVFLKYILDSALERYGTPELKSLKQEVPIVTDSGESHFWLTAKVGNLKLTIDPTWRQFARSYQELEIMESDYVKDEHNPTISHRVTQDLRESVTAKLAQRLQDAPMIFFGPSDLHVKQLSHKVEALEHYVSAVRQLSAPAETQPPSQGLPPLNHNDDPKL